MGLAAQSVGGGGGRGGKAGATSGGADDDLPLLVFDQVSKGFGIPDSTTEVVDGIFLIKDRIKGDLGTLSTLEEKVTGDAQDPENPRSFSPELDVSVAVGGKGGAAGKGGDVTLTNTGQIATQGAHADAVIGQSVGGGGGIGGGSSASGAATDDTRYEFSLSMGGSGGAAGDGGKVTVANPGLVRTSGVGAFGLVAQSVGGGGRGGASGDANSSALSFGVSLGGGGGATGDGGDASVNTCPRLSSCTGGSVSTNGKHAVGVLAQSVGGGGGLIRTMRLDQQGDQSKSDDSDDPDTHDIFLDFGQPGASGASGNGGKANVDLSGTSVTTTGRNAHGVVALSVGGGGGAVGGGVVNRIQRTPSAGAPSGDGGDVTIELFKASVGTSGTNSAGLWAASIGGGGVALLTDSKKGAAFGPSVPDGQVGDAGRVAILLNSSTVAATGGGPAIIAHSIAGGGVSPADGGSSGPAERWASVDGQLSYFGQGIAGNVLVDLTGGSTARAADSSAIVAASVADNEKGNDASSTAFPLVRIVGSSAINASFDRATVAFESFPNPSKLLNATGGTITNTVEGGYAVHGGDFAPVDIVNSGTITGNIDGSASSAAAAASGSTIDNQAGGVLAPYDTIDLGAAGRLSNAGVVEVSGVRRRGGTTLTGDLVQSGTGRLRFDLDSAAGKVDHLHVTGAATLAGGFEIVPTTLRPGRHEILSAGGGVALGEDFAGVGTHLFGYEHELRDGRLSVAPTADFSADGSDTEDRKEVAEHLQRIWDAGGDGFAGGFAALASIADGDAEAFAAAVDSLSTQSVAAIGYARYLGSQAFAQATYSCPRFEDAGVFRTQASCGWLRARGSWLDRHASDDDPGFDFEALTTALGGQAEVADDLFLGGAVGWEAGRLDQDDSGTRVKGDAYLGAVSLKRALGPWTLTGAADLGWGDYDSDREIVVGATRETASGSPDAFNAGLHARAAYQIPRGTWYAEPALDLDLVYVRLDGYTESGAGDLDLEVDDVDTVVATGTPWLKLGRRIDFTQGVTLDAYVSAGVSLSTGEDFDTDARFADAPSGADDFTTRLDNPSVVGRLSAGVDLYATDRVQLRLQYDGSFADDQTANGGQIRLSYFF